MQELEAKLTELTDKWMSLIGPEHHKDRDCHFYIERRWSYGEPPKWRAQHSGYWCDKPLDVVCGTYREALQKLISYLTEWYDDSKKIIDANNAEDKARHDAEQIAARL